MQILRSSDTHGARRGTGARPGVIFLLTLVAALGGCADDARLQDSVQTAAQVADAGASEASTAGDAGARVVRLPPVSSIDADGPFAVTENLRGGPRGRSGLFYPTALGRDGLAHPIFVWGCGGGATPSSYAVQLRRIASHGFVVIAEVSEIGDNGAPLTAALTWLTAQNDETRSPFHQKLQPRAAALGGHSIGSVNSFIVAPDPRWVTTIHVAGGSLDNVRNVNAPTTGIGGRGLVHPAAFICSANDLFGNVEKSEKDYANATAPVFFTIMSGTEHIGATREALPVILAWLRWQVGGESERRGMFLDADGAFRTGRYGSRSKNW